MRRVNRGLLLLLGILTAAGCTRGEKGEVRGVDATAAYTRHFGAAPTVKEGSCSAVVAYFPLTENPATVRPVPLFLFSTEGRMEKVVRHILAMDGESLGPALVNPFPPGTEVETVTRDGETAEVQLAFSGQAAPDPRRVQGMASSLVHTLAQFPGVRRVRIVADGKPLPNLDPAGIVPDSADVLEPEAPRPLGVAGTWEKGTPTPEEVLVLFDRPVSVSRIEVLSGETPVAGDYYQSAFDMAVVIRPARAELVREGMPVRVRWQVADRLGRGSEGEKDFSLKRQDRP